MTANARTHAPLTFEDELDVVLSQNLEEVLEKQKSRPAGWEPDDIDKLLTKNPAALNVRIGTVKDPAVRLGVDWGLDATAETPKEMFAREIAAAQTLLDAAQTKQANAKAEFQRRNLEIKSQRERLQALEGAQKDTLARIKAQEKAIRIHRQAVFGLQEAGR